MKEKIIQLMKSEGLTPSRLAEILEVQPSGISHLVSGRNRPSFDLLQKILRRFPNINPYWLMLDAEDMYLGTIEEKRKKEVSHHPTKSELTDDTSVDLFSLPLSSTSNPVAVESDKPTSVSSNIEQIPSKVKRVILFYEDGSCESFAVK